MFIRAVANAFPEKVLENSAFVGSNMSLSALQERMFKGTARRHHVTHSETAVEHFVRATQELVDTAGLDLQAVDGILTNVSLPDLPFTGAAVHLARSLGITPKHAIDLHNGGCVSFIFLLEHARRLFQLGEAGNLLIAVGQTAAGRVFGHAEIMKKPQASIPGDGFSVAWIAAAGGCVRVREILTRVHPEFADDMCMCFDDGRKYWQPGAAPGYLEFPEGKIARVINRGNRLVPEAMRAVLAQAKVRPHYLVTNQPNLYFLRNWREAVQLPEERHVHSFSEHGNLFQSGIPVNLARALESGLGRAGVGLLAGFAHAGDHSGACLVEPVQ